MGKHNGKARRRGMQVGTALTNRVKVGLGRGAGLNGLAQHKHTTDYVAPGDNMQSVLHRNDLDELLAMADLADRDFSAEKTQVMVVSMGTVDAASAARSSEERRAAQARSAHLLRIPRRPAWTSDMAPEALDAQERSAFLQWRRDLARLEEGDRLLLTPFEKNLEVWRQLWRVLERSDIVVQVVDARDPLVYVSRDLMAYARELHPSKASFVLLNKADLLPQHVRAAWADYFDAAGVGYAFWSAVAVIQEHLETKAEANAVAGAGPSSAALAAELVARKRAAARSARAGEDPRTRVVDADELVDLLEAHARRAVAAAGAGDPRAADASRRAMVGLVGYPNVGKSSTINALFGSKKTAVAPTPGKTKHFQTLNVSPSVCLCDCPGLVLPRFANSKDEMVAAGVVPIDKLTEIRGPVEVVAQRVGRDQLQAVYGLRLPTPRPPEPANRPPTAPEVLHALAVLRGWTTGSGLADEVRAGRMVLKDYCAGKLVHCSLPPAPPAPGDSVATSVLGATSGGGWVPSKAESAAALAAKRAAVEREDADDDDDEEEHGTDEEDEDDDGDEEEERPTASGSEEADEVVPAIAAPTAAARAAAAAAAARAAAGAAVAASPAGPSSSAPAAVSQQKQQQAAMAAADDFDAADMELLESIRNDGAAARGGGAKRPEYKFHKKAARTKGNRGQAKDAGGYDGAALQTGKKGGLMRVAGY